MAFKQFSLLLRRGDYCGFWASVVCGAFCFVSLLCFFDTFCFFDFGLLFVLPKRLIALTFASIFPLLQAQAILPISGITGVSSWLFLVL